MALVDPATGEIVPTPPAVVVEHDTLAEYRQLDEQVDAAEQDGIMARWEFGKMLLAERLANGGKQLPHGRLDEIAEAVGKSRSEIKHRLWFAERMPHGDEVVTAVTTFRSWTELRDSLGSGGDVGGSDESPGDEWYTPLWLFKALGLRFSIDVCSPADRTHVSAPCESYYTEADDGLSQPWQGTIWCNPPYSTPAPWAERCVEHNDGLLLCHMPMNAGWCVDVWHAAAGIRLFQGMEFVLADGSLRRPGYWLQLAAFGPSAGDALAQLETPPEIASNPRRVPSPMWIAA